MTASSVPDRWADVAFGDICKVIGGYAFKSKHYQDEGVPLIRISSLSDGLVQFDEKTRYLPEEYYDEYERFRLSRGDILMALSGATTGKVGVYDRDEPALLNQRVGLFKPNEAVDSGFLGYLVRSIQDAVLKAAHGGAQPNISPSKIEKMRIGVPPLNEQRRIVAKIEELTARSRNAKQALDAIPPLLERFRQSVLAAAFRGDLTKQWRAQNPNTEPATELLKRIRKERRHRWEQDYLEKQKAKGNPLKNDKWKAKYKEPEPVDTTDLPELPQGWCWAPLEALSEFVTDGDHNPPKRIPEGIPHLTARNIRNWEVNYDKCTFISPADFEKVRKRYEPCPGDVIITCVGTVGETAIIPEGTVFSADRNLAAVRLLPGLAPEVLQFFLNSPVLTYRMHTSSGSTAQPHLYLKQLRAFPIPLPPIHEQAAMQDLVNTRLQEMQTVVTAVEEAIILRTRLEQSIPAKAFRGELVPQDPNDEAAITLLARVENKRPRSVRGAS